MSFSSNPDECYACKELEEELSKLRSIIRAIEQLPTHLGLAGDFDYDYWINRRDLDKVLNDKAYK